MRQLDQKNIIGNMYRKYLKRLIQYGKISIYDLEIELGKYYGYPKCCREYYGRLVYFKIPPFGFNKFCIGVVSKQTKHVPCPKCLYELNLLGEVFERDFFE